MPKNPSHEDMVIHISAMHSKATQQDRASGSDWYTDAHDAAATLADRYDITDSVAAGVIAALSPLTPWGRNLELAEMALRLPWDDDDWSLPTLGANAAKARRILSGEDPWTVLTGQKVRAFFEGILYNGETDVVCVDRHALSVAHGGFVPKSDQGMTPRQYAQVVAAYQDVAASVGIPAAKLQAITWVTWRRIRGIVD
jgi:hypothetical protein